MYSTRSHAYTADSEDILGRFADQAAILLTNMHTLSEAEALDERLRRALHDRDLIATDWIPLSRSSGCASSNAPK